MPVVSMLKSRDLYEFIQGKYPQDEFTRFSDGTYRSVCAIHGGTNDSSFAVFPDNSWYCFSCNKGGNIIDYLMEREGLTYSAAVHELCQEYSIDLSQDKTFEEQQSIAQKYESWCKTYEKDVGKCVEYLKQKRG
jgi:DNA primase